MINGESNLTSRQKALTGFSFSPRTASLPAEHVTALYTCDSCLMTDSQPVFTGMRELCCGLFIQLVSGRSICNVKEINH